MNRLMENTVFSGFVMAWRFATWPTRISPSFVNPTTDGVSRLPSWFAITVGLPPSTTETTEFVVPRSMPITFAMSCSPSSFSTRAPARARGGSRACPARLPWPPDLEDVDLDLFRLQLFRLRQPDLQHAVAIGRLHFVGLNGHRQLHQALELPVRALEVQERLLLQLLLEPALASDGQQIPRDRHGHVLLVYARDLDREHEVVLGLVHVHERRPLTPRLTGPGGGTREEAVEQPVHLTLDVAEIAERLPTLHRRSERTPTLHRHESSSFSPCPASSGGRDLEYILLISTECVSVKSSPLRSGDIHKFLLIPTICTT